MKKILTAVVAILTLAIPSVSFAANYTIPWNATSSSGTLITPYILNGIQQIPFASYFIASSTTRASTFPYASTTALTVSGSSYLGTVLSGAWNGTAIPFAFGGTGLASAADDTVMVSSGSAWVASAVPNCTDISGNHLNYTAASNTFSCGTTSSGGGGGGTDVNWSFFNNSGIRLGTTTNQILASSATQTATSTLAKLEVAFNSVAGGSIFAYGSTTLQNFTGVNATTTNATSTNIAVSGTLSLTNALGLIYGGTGLSSAADDTTLVSTGSAWVAKTLPDCTDTGGNHLNYTQGTNAYSCGTSSSGGGSTFPFTAQTGYVSTSTIVAFFAGSMNTASSTHTATTTFGPTASAITTENNIATSSTTVVDWGKGNKQLVRIGSTAITFSFTNAFAGQSETLTVCNPGTTAGTITWPTTISWPGGVQPGQTTTSNQCDVWSFMYSQATSTSKYLLTGLISGFQ